MGWFRKSAPVPDRPRAVGLDLTASRARADALGGGRSWELPLDPPYAELPLFISGERRSPEVGRAGVALCRKLPHLVCSGFLSALGTSREWRIGRHTLIAEGALTLAFEKLRGPIAAATDAVAMALPAYLSPTQVTRVTVTAGRARLPLKGTAVGALAVAADRAAALLTGRPVAPSGAAEWVVPLRPTAGGPGSVLVIDADECALSAAAVGVDRDCVRLTGLAVWPQLALKLWKDKLLDGLADRCVRQCRRDPRDSADAEQTLFEQLDDALDRAATGQRVSFLIQTTHWFQDILQQPDELDTHCVALSRQAGEGIRAFVAESGSTEPPRAVWLTHAAARLPGLARAVHANTPEGTAVEALSADAVGVATAALVPRWLAGDLPRAHLDSVIPVLNDTAAGTGATARAART